MKERIPKVTKRLSAMLAAVMALVLCLGMLTFAAEITVNAPEGVTASGMGVNAYKILDLANEGTGNQATYTVTDEFADFFAGAKTAYTAADSETAAADTIYVTYASGALVISTEAAAGAIAVDNTVKLDSTYFEADLLSRLSTNSADLGQMSAWLTDYIAANNLTTTDTATVGEGESSANITGLEAGYYVVTTENVPDGISITSSILQVTTADGTYTINLKAEEIPFEKTVDNPSDQAQVGGDAAAAVGDRLDYVINTRVPNPADFSDITEYIISDTLTNQSLINDSLVLTIGGTEIENIADIAEVNYGTYADGRQTFSLTFDTADLAAYKGQTLSLAYSAELRSEAVNINGNDATLEYTNSGNESVQTDHTDVYTYGMDIQKVFSDGSTNYNAVSFQLRTAADNPASAVSFAGGNGVYKKADSDDTSTTTSLGLSSDGSLTLTGLAEGTYYLVETATDTDAGFNLADTITVTLTADEDAKSDLDQNGTSAVMGSTDLDISVSEDGSQISLAGFEVLNQKGFDLPTTGGAGTWMFTIGGIVLIGAACCVFIAVRKKSR